MTEWKNNCGLKSNVIFAKISSNEPSMQFAVEASGQQINDIKTLQDRSAVHMLGLFHHFIENLINNLISILIVF